MVTKKKVSKNGAQSEHILQGGSRDQGSFSSFGNSITDSDIQRCNGKILKLSGGVAGKVWALGKELGVFTSGKEDEFVKKIQQMEERDRVVMLTRGERIGPI